ncbi:MAG: spermidine synthase [Actinomycetes bacterium]
MTRRSGPRAGTYPIATGTAELVPDRTDPAMWTLWVNGVPSSPVHLDDPRVLDFEYLQWMADVLDVAGPPGPVDVVHLGGGACALARHVDAVRPGSRQVVVELDAELARRAREWFDLPRAPRLRLQTGDAREGLARRRDASADAVVRDAFAGDRTPGHLTTAEFLRDVRRVLRPDGLYLANVAGGAGDAGARVLREEAATAGAVFGHVALLAEPAALRRRRWANAVLVASAEALPVRDLVRRASSGAVPARLVHGDALTDLVAGARPRHDPTPPP